MIGWDPKTEVAPSSHQQKKKKTKRKVIYWKGLLADRPIAITPGEEDKNISWTRGTQVPQASVKNSIKFSP